MIQGRQLVYRKRSKDNLAAMEEDLRICTVKPVYDGERRFCFEVLSPARFVEVVLALNMIKQVCRN